MGIHDRRRFKKGQSHKRIKSRRRLRLEPLEDRLLLAVDIVWVNRRK